MWDPLLKGSILKENVRQGRKKKSKVRDPSVEQKRENLKRRRQVNELPLASGKEMQDPDGMDEYRTFRREEYPTANPLNRSETEESRKGTNQADHFKAGGRSRGSLVGAGRGLWSVK